MEIVKDLNGENVLLSSTGTKLANIGQLTITTDGNISTTLISNYQDKDIDTQNYINGIIKF